MNVVNLAVPLCMLHFLRTSNLPWFVHSNYASFSKQCKTWHCSLCLFHGGKCYNLCHTWGAVGQSRWGTSLRKCVGINISLLASFHTPCFFTALRLSWRTIQPSQHRTQKVRTSLYLTLYAVWMLRNCDCIIQYAFIQLADWNVLLSVLEYRNSEQLKTALYWISPYLAHSSCI
jgi:hypothetical protein